MLTRKEKIEQSLRIISPPPRRLSQCRVDIENQLNNYERAVMFYNWSKSGKTRESITRLVKLNHHLKLVQQLIKDERTKFELQIPEQLDLTIDRLVKRCELVLGPRSTSLRSALQLTSKR